MYLLLSCKHLGWTQDSHTGHKMGSYNSCTIFNMQNIPVYSILASKYQICYNISKELTASWSILFSKCTPKITPAVVTAIRRPVIAITPSPDTTGDLRSALWVWPAYSKSPFIFPCKNQEQTLKRSVGEIMVYY